VAVVVGPFEQCGGRGGSCGGSCEDGPWPASGCTLGYACSRRSESVWQCRPGPTQAAQPGRDGGDAPAAGTSLQATASWSATGGGAALLVHRLAKRVLRPPAPQLGAAAGRLATHSLVPRWGCLSLCQLQPAWARLGDQVQRGAGQRQLTPPPPAPTAALQLVRPWNQCGGASGRCSDHGACADAAWPGTACPSGHLCARLSRGHWQCQTEEVAREAAAGQAAYDRVTRAAGRAMSSAAAAGPAAAGLLTAKAAGGSSVAAAAHGAVQAAAGAPPSACVPSLPAWPAGPPAPAFPFGQLCRRRR
jgi:hypothetical protein